MGEIMRNPVRALIVDDREDDALLIVMELQRQGYDVEYERVDTAAAMDVILDAKTWDVVLSDHSMPHFDSLSALQILQGKNIDIPFIVVSFAIGEQMAVQVMKAGACDYVMKGNLTRLGPAIEREIREAEVRGAKRKAEDERERLIKELQDSLAQVKTLKGLLPICAMCKKIRDDSGYWHQVEAFVRDHTDAEFSHSYCPECAEAALRDVEKVIAGRK